MVLFTTLPVVSYKVGRCVSIWSSQVLVVAEWLSWCTWNPLGSLCVGWNPANNVTFLNPSLRPHRTLTQLGIYRGRALVINSVIETPQSRPLLALGPCFLSGSSCLIDRPEISSGIWVLSDWFDIKIYKWTLPPSNPHTHTIPLNNTSPEEKKLVSLAEFINDTGWRQLLHKQLGLVNLKNEVRLHLLSAALPTVDNISPDIVPLLAAGYFTNFIEVPAVTQREHILQTSLKDLLTALRVTLQDAQLS